jgi:hypothetical protein
VREDCPTQMLWETDERRQWGGKRLFVARRTNVLYAHHGLHVADTFGPGWPPSIWASSCGLPNCFRRDQICDFFKKRL